MPIYVLKDLKTGVIDEHLLAIAEYDAARDAGDGARLSRRQREAADGGPVLHLRGRLYAQVYATAPAAVGGWGAKYPIESFSMACHPSQIKDYAEKSRRAGVPTDFTPAGRPILNSRQHARAFRKAHNYYDINGYTD